LCTLIAPTPAQSESPEADVERLVTEAMTAQGIPGLALAVIRNGQVVLARGYGWADREASVPMTAATLLETASLAKPLVATTLLTLVADETATPDTPLRTVLPEIPFSWSAITLRHLLTHTSGLPYEAGMGTVSADDGDGLTSDAALWAILAEADAIPLNGAPGERWEYSDLGYQLLALAIARLADTPSAEAIRERVFARAAMPGAVISADRPALAAAGYRPTRDGVMRSPDGANDQPLVPGGGIYLSLDDYLAWDAALNSGALLPDDLQRAMWTPAALNDGTSIAYGLGWSVREVAGGRVVEHGGGSLNVTHRYVRYLDAGLSVIVLSNLAFSRAGELAHQVAALVDPALAEPSPAPDSLTADPFPEVTALLRTVFAGMLDGDLSPDLFTEAAQAEFFDDLLAAGEDLAVVGAPTSYRLLEFSEADGLRSYRYEVEITVTAFVTLTLDDNGKIAGFEISL
jgi:CubicO group peptidase (beta-lactamase class C family)